MLNRQKRPQSTKLLRPTISNQPSSTCTAAGSTRSRSSTSLGWDNSSAAHGRCQSSSLTGRSGLDTIRQRDEQLSKFIRLIYQTVYRDKDTSGLMESMNILEQAFQHLKSMYEIELEASRKETEELKRTQHQLMLELSRHKSQTAELQNRLASEKDRSSNFERDAKELSSRLEQQMKDTERLEQQLQKYPRQLDLKNEQIKAIEQQKHQLQQMFDEEILRRQDQEEKVKELENKMNFNCLVHDQEVADLTRRLHAASACILKLDSVIRMKIGIPDQSVSELLDRAREAAQAEMGKCRCDKPSTDTVVHGQGGSTNDMVEYLKRENTELHEKVVELSNKLGNSQSKISSQEYERMCLERRRESELRHCLDQVRLYQNSLSEMMGVASNRQQFGLDVNLGQLKVMIESLRGILGAEENRLKMLPSSTEQVSLSYGQSMPSSVQSDVNPTSTAFAQTSGITMKPVGPVCCRTSLVVPSTSAIESTTLSKSLIPSNAGQGHEYFDAMYNDLKITKPPATNGCVPCTHSSLPTFPSTADDYKYATCVSSATSDIHIVEVNPDGEYIRLINVSANKDEEIGNYILQQNISGAVVSMFRFPARLCFAALSTITVWSGVANPQLHHPPTDFVFKEQSRWGTGPEYTTLLCNSSRKVIAWSSRSHRMSKDIYQVDLPKTPGNKQELNETGKTSVSLNTGTGFQMEPQRLSSANDLSLNREKERPVMLQRPGSASVDDKSRAISGRPMSAKFVRTPHVSFQEDNSGSFDGQARRSIRSATKRMPSECP